MLQVSLWTKFRNTKCSDVKRHYEQNSATRSVRILQVSLGTKLRNTKRSNVTDVTMNKTGSDELLAGPEVTRRGRENVKFQLLTDTWSTTLRESWTPITN